MIATAGEVGNPLNGGVTTLLPDGRVFVAPANNAEIYDPHSGTFTLTGPFAAPNSNYPNTVTLLSNGKVLVTSCDSICSVERAELFDPQSGTFSMTSPMTTNYPPDFGYSATLLADGRVLFVGSDPYQSAADVEVYNPTTGTFASVGSVIKSQAMVPATALADGTVLIAGGQLPGGEREPRRRALCAR